MENEKKLTDYEVLAEVGKKTKNAAIGEAFVNACKELNLDPEETEKKIIAKFNGEDATEFLANTEFFKAIINSLSYEDDMLAAEARGRNANMQERDKRKSMGSDGLHSYPNTYTGGARTFVGFNGFQGKAFYWRTKYAEYGRQEAYPLEQQNRPKGH